MSKINKQRVLLKKNTISSLMFQISTILCGFIIPRLILNEYGSDINGLVSSIKQFLSIISFLELGVGAVVQSSLYKPLATNDFLRVNQIITSANKFFTKLGQILIVYVVILLFIFPFVINDKFGYFYTGLLILSISISYFSQYFFGIVDRLYLNSAQRGYIQYNVQTITLLLNILFSFILVRLHCKIQVFQLFSSLIYLIRPIYLRYYVNHNYKISRCEKYDVEPISQKWNGIAQHVASVILDSTDVIVLTLFSSLSNVSIYSVYYLVVSGVKTLVLSLTNGIQALEGELWANEQTEKLKLFYQKMEWILHMISLLLFLCTAVLITPFVQVYSKGIRDANYCQPLFGVLITVANASHCLRLPYNIMILAAGHYKQTQNNYIVAAVLNLICSIVVVSKFGLIGVAIGTLVAMIYQTVWMACYNSKYLVKNTKKNTMKLFGVDCIMMLLVSFYSLYIQIKTTSYVEWGLYAILIFIIMCIILFLVNIVFYKYYTYSVLRHFKILKPK